VGGQRLPVGEQEDEPRFRAAVQQRLAVGAPQGGTGHDCGLARGDPFIHPAADGVQPRPAIGVGERVARAHFLDVAGRVERIRVSE
jgi:hypothetical protein